MAKIIPCFNIEINEKTSFLVQIENDDVKNGKIKIGNEWVVVSELMELVDALKDHYPMAFAE